MSADSSAGAICVAANAACTGPGGCGCGGGSNADTKLEEILYMLDDNLEMLVFSGRMQYIYGMGLASPGSTNNPHPDMADMASLGGGVWSGASYSSGTDLTTVTGEFGTPVGGGALGDSVKPGMVVIPDLHKAVPLHIESVNINLLGSDTLTVKGDATGLGGNGTRFSHHRGV